jgi:hypothetical protein
VLQVGCTQHLPRSVDHNVQHAGLGFNFDHNLDIPTTYSVHYWCIPKGVKRGINEFQHERKKTPEYAHNQSSNPNSITKMPKKINPNMQESNNHT